MHNSELQFLKTVKKSERKKFALMSLLFFFILFNYYLIYTLKEALIAPVLGAEIMGFIELWIVLPAIFLFTFCYIKLSIIIPDKKKLFYLICITFIIFFTVFAFYLYPNLDVITLNDEKTELFSLQFPHLKWFIILYSNWPLALYNIFSDLWINTLCLLFWQYANNITSSEQAKRFYPIFSLIGNFSLIISGLILKKTIIYIEAEKTVIYITFLIIIITIICILIFRHLQQIPASKLVKIMENDITNHLSFKESLLIIFRSKYLWYIAVAVISYGITINLSHGLWRAQVIKLYPTTKEYILFISEYHKWVGIFSFIIMFFATILIRKFSWLKSAMTTPIIMLLSGSLFYIWVSFENYISSYIQQYSYLFFCVIIGSFHITFVKSVKFSFFDTTKELAYIPLNRTLKDKGKAAVDILAERLGKSGGAFIQSFLFTLMPSISYNEIAPIFFFISLVIWVIWLFAIKALNKEYSLAFEKY